MENSRMPDRLNYSTKANKTIDRIDEDNYMGLGKSGSITRSELFLFAMSLGVESGVKTPLINPYTGGLVLDKSIDPKTRACMYAQFIYTLADPDKKLDEITDKGGVYKFAEQYANTGFEILADYLDYKKPFDLALEMFQELDEAYEKIKLDLI